MKHKFLRGAWLQSSPSLDSKWEWLQKGFEQGPKPHYFLLRLDLAPAL